MTIFTLNETLPWYNWSAHDDLKRNGLFFGERSVESDDIFLMVWVRDYDEELSPAKIVRIELKAIDPPQLLVFAEGVRDQDGPNRIESRKVVLVTVRVQTMQ